MVSVLLDQYSVLLKTKKVAVVSEMKIVYFCTDSLRAHSKVSNVRHFWYLFLGGGGGGSGLVAVFQFSSCLMVVEEEAAVEEVMVEEEEAVEEAMVVVEEEGTLE